MDKNILNEHEFLSFNFILKYRIENIFDEYDDNYYKILQSPVTLNITNEDYIIDKEYDIGFIEIWYVNGTRAFDNNLDIVDICDSHERELYEYASAIYKDRCIDSKLVEMPRTHDILILHRIEIDKEYQGNKYGILISQNIIKHFGYNCGAILIRPSPIQFSDISKNDNWRKKYYSEKFSLDEEESRIKLSNYWKRIHKRIRNSNRKDIIYIPQD
jgi:hypothetical protein